MNEEEPEHLEERVLVQAPTARDAATSRSLLEAKGIQCFVCNTIEDVCYEVTRGAAAGIVTAEAVIGDKEGRLARLVQAQPPWSDLPLIILTPPGAESPELLRKLDEIGHMTLMQRPIQISVLISSVQAAFRDRLRQYELRNHLIEQQRAQKVIYDERERYKVTLASIGDGVIATDRTGCITFLNPVAQRLTDWTLAEARGKPLDDVLIIANEQTREPVENPAIRALKDGVIIGLASHTILTSRGGVERPIDDSAAPIKDATGATVGVVLTFRDVTEKRTSDEQLRRSEQELSDFFENATIGLHWVGPDGIIMRVNKAELDLLGYSKDEYLGKHIANFHVDQDVIRDILNRLQARETLHDCPARMRCKDGSIRDVLIHSSVRWKDGAFIHTRCFTRDVTEQKCAEDRIRFQAHLLDAVEQAAIVTEPDGTIIYWNRFAESLYGWPSSEAVGRNVIEVVVPSESAAQAAEIMRLLRAGKNWSGEFLVRRRDGTVFPVFVTDTPILDDQKELKAIIGVSVDITDRKHTELGLRFLADASATLAVLVDYQSTLQKLAALAVPQFADWCAIDMVELDGSLRRLAAVHVDPAKATLAQEFHLRYPPDPDSVHGLHWVLRTGESDLMTDISDSLLTQRTTDKERIRRLQDLGFRSFMYVPLKEQDRPIGVVSFATGESGRRYTKADLAFAEELARRAALAIENAQLYAELKKADRRKDEFLATLAHELRNPIAPIRNGLQVLRLANERAAREQAREMMERQLGQLVRLVDDLLDISRISQNKLVLRKARVPLSSVIDNAVETARPLIQSNGHVLILSVPTKPIYLEADLTRLAQVFWNLLNNSAKYTNPGGRIDLVAWQNGSEVVVAVRDNGIGIAVDALPDLFTLFSQVEPSLERSQGGLGIGLALVKGLVEMHGGSVEARSAGLGQGSEFVVRLPVAKPAQVGQVTASSQAENGFVKRRILVVDDNRDGAASLGMMLSLVGHDTRIAHDGFEALELAEAFRPEIILLDIGLPKLNGYDTCRQIREQAWGKGMFIVAVTGWGQEDDRRRSEQAGFNYHIVKPVDFAILEKLLDGLEVSNP